MTRVRAIVVGILLFFNVLDVSAALAARSPVAERKHREAEEQLIAGETDAALALVEEGLAAAPRDKDLLLLRGHVLLRRGDYEAAATAYRVYLAAGATGRNKREVGRILESLDQVSTTTLVVRVTNGPAEVRLDTRTGRPMCTASPECKKGVIPGDHLVVVDRPGFVRVTRRVVVEAAATETVEVTLVPRPSPLVVKVTPARATVTVDGAPAGKELAAGEHTLAVTHPGHLRHVQTVRAEGGEPIELEVTLRPGIPITVSPPTAAIAVDGKAVEIVDGMLPIESGARQVVASAPGYHPLTVELPAASLALLLRPLGAYLLVAGGTDGATVVVDGEPRGTLPLARPLELEPGEHTVEIRRQGRPSLRRTAVLAANQESTLHLQAARGPRTKAWISAGVMLAGLGAGTYFGTQALAKMEDYDARATDHGVGVADEMQLALEDDGSREALIADISFGVAAVAMVASIYFFRTEGRKAAGRIEVRPVPGGLGVSGSF